jgi:hypothetical protein
MRLGGAIRGKWRILDGKGDEWSDLKFRVQGGVSTKAYAWKTCTRVRWAMIISLTAS